RLMQGDDFILAKNALPRLAFADNLGRLHRRAGREFDNVVVDTPREEPLDDGQHAVRHIRRLYRNRVDDLADIAPVDIGDWPAAPRLDEAPECALGVFALALLAKLLFDENLGDGGERIRSLAGFGEAFTLKLDARVLAVFKHLYPLRCLLPAPLQRNHGIA